MPNLLAERLVDEANRHLKVSNYAAAAPLIDEALAIEPKNFRALASGAIVVANAGKKELALDMIKKALKLKPDAPMVIREAAYVFWSCGQRHRARQLWERLDEMEPRSPGTLWFLAMYYFIQSGTDGTGCERQSRLRGAGGRSCPGPTPFTPTALRTPRTIGTVTVNGWQPLRAPNGIRLSCHLAQMV
jgi:tetratricopeptide (TPR) repeat protein